MADESLLDGDDIARLLNLPSPKAVSDRLYRDPESIPPSFKVGGLRRWHPDDVSEWIDARRTEGKKEVRDRTRPASVPVRRRRKATPVAKQKVASKMFVQRRNEGTTQDG